MRARPISVPIHACCPATASQPAVQPSSSFTHLICVPRFRGTAFRASLGPPSRRPWILPGLKRGRVSGFLGRALFVVFVFVLVLVLVLVAPATAGHEAPGRRRRGLFLPKTRRTSRSNSRVWSIYLSILATGVWFAYQKSERDNNVSEETDGRVPLNARQRKPIDIYIFIAPRVYKFRERQAVRNLSLTCVPCPSAAIRAVLSGVAMHDAGLLTTKYDGKVRQTCP